LFFGFLYAIIPINYSDVCKSAANLRFRRSNVLTVLFPKRIL
jgi:hypothetical protein